MKFSHEDELAILNWRWDLSEDKIISGHPDSPTEEEDDLHEETLINLIFEQLKILYELEISTNI